jgi:threonine dehydratase
MNNLVTLQEIQQAAKHLNNVVIRTPTIEAPWLSQVCNGKVYLKLENLQLTGSFKPRGAYIKMLALTPEEKQRGVIAMSAGNHAQGVAYHAQQLNIPAIIVMPLDTPRAKVERTEALGATVVLAGTHLAESAITAQELVEEEGYSLIHPYDDPAIITGQGTVALELLEDTPEIDTLIVPVGGGGLAAGMAIAAHGINPSIGVYGVQSTYCPAMIQALYPERSFVPPAPGTTPIAEGIAVKAPGILTQTILHEHLRDILDVSDEEIEIAMNKLMTSNKLITEGAGAAGVAALLAHPDLFYGRTIGIVICGGNIDARIISSLVLRGLIHDGKLVRLKVQINDAPGVLSKMTGIIGNTGANIFELSHQRLFNHINLKMAEVDVIVETRGLDHVTLITKLLTDQGFPTKIIE